MSGPGLTAIVARSLSVQAVSIAVQSILMLASITILSRILDANAFGESAAAIAVVAVAQLLSEAGLGSAVVQRKDADDAFIATAFLIAVVFYAVASVALLAAAPLIASLNDSKTMAGLLRCASISLLFAGIGSVPIALLQRRLQFFRLMIVITVSMFLSMLVVAPILALRGFGAWALVIGFTGNVILRAVFAVALARFATWPRWESNAVRHLFRFGAGITLSRVFNYLSQNGYKLVLGRLLGFAPLGYMERTSYVQQMAATQTGTLMDTVLFPVFSRIQDNRLLTQRAYLRAFEAAWCGSCVIGTVLFAFSPEIVRLMLGDRWMHVAPIMGILFLAFPFLIATRLGDVVLRSRAAVYLSASIKGTAALVSLLAIVLASRFGLVAVASAMAITAMLLSCAMAYACRRVLGIPLFDEHAVLWRGLFLAFLTYAFYRSASAFSEAVCPTHEWIVGLLTVTVTMVLVLTLLLAFPQLFGEHFERVAARARQYCRQKWR